MLPRRGPYLKNNRNNVNKPNYYCSLCKVKGHSISRCRIFAKAKEIIKGYERKKIINYAQIAHEDIDDERLDDIKTEFMEGLNWNEETRNRALIINNLLVDPNIFSEDNTENVHDQETRDSSSEEYRSADESDQSENYLYDEVEENQKCY